LGQYAYIKANLSCDANAKNLEYYDMNDEDTKLGKASYFLFHDHKSFKQDDSNLDADDDGAVTVDAVCLCDHPLSFDSSFNVNSFCSTYYRFSSLFDRNVNFNLI
jgi:hypothetical protein